MMRQKLWKLGVRRADIVGELLRPPKRPGAKLPPWFDNERNHGFRRADDSRQNQAQPYVSRRARLAGETSSADVEGHETASALDH
ncbi:hypothetical protein HY546_01360 [archaeon]|nr:hypothetical protein [archaeon]